MQLFWPLQLLLSLISNHKWNKKHILCSSHQLTEGQVLFLCVNSGSCPISHWGLRTTGSSLFWTIYPMNTEGMIGLSKCFQANWQIHTSAELTAGFSTMGHQSNMEKEKPLSRLPWRFQNLNKRSLLKLACCFLFQSVLLEQNQPTELNSCSFRWQKHELISCFWKYLNSGGLMRGKECV